MDYQGRTTRIDLEGMLVDESMGPKALPLSLLEEITDSFSQYCEIGTGGFAVVYRGILGTGTVAVKKLSNAYIQEKEFEREVESLMRVRHKNIVRFLGYCADTQGSMQMYKKKYVMADVRQRLLCFEYVPKGSLQDYITDASCGLLWRKRYQIIKGVCEGLNYLHINRVVHLDLKPANILMDDNIEPKIADFGLSRCFDEGQSLIMVTKVAGTLGYLPPEFNNRVVTRHYDIYSLGVIIIEILTGKKGYHAIEDVLDSWRNRLEESLEDTDLEQIRVCANIGKECTKNNPEKRPKSVQHIIDRLKETECADESSLEMHTSNLQSEHEKGKAMQSMEDAMVSISYGVMGSLIVKLGHLLTEENNILKKAKGQVLFLKYELESLHVFLKKILDTEHPKELDEYWAREVRELSYDIEDKVDEFMLHMELKTSSKLQGLVGFIDRSSKLLTNMNIRYGIAKEFEGLKVHVLQVQERLMRYHKQTDGVTSRLTNTTIDLRLLAIYADASGLVGIDSPRDELIQLMDGDDELKVLSIVGTGGLGKTTLANEIYRKLKGKFKCRVFVSMSQKPNIRKLLRSMLFQAGYVAPVGAKMELWVESELISALRKLLLKQRYLIVIDDIWEATTWDTVKCALPENINGSRVLITTRIETVARACCEKNIEYVYKMKALSDQDSRRLFFKRIFGSEEACPPHLMEVSAQILKKYGGLPLAIITTSSLIASQPSKLMEHWEHVRYSLGSNFEMNPSFEGMRQILNFSYINLPHYLKTCMLYLGIYPEDYTINKNDLVRQWVSEGFICEACGIDPEDIAKSYFNELINRSLIQPVDIDYNGEVMSCRIHDMMLDFILHKCVEDNFITVIDDIQDLSGYQRNKIRRLSLRLDGGIDERVERSFQLSQTRLLARFGASLYLPPILQFKHLHVLMIEISTGSYSSKLLNLGGICDLFQLGFLKIIANGHHVLLPSKIGRLQQLKTFEIDAVAVTYNGQSVLQLPSDIVHLTRLSHLIVPEDVIFPDGVSNMKSLRTVCRFNLKNSLDNIKGLRQLTNLTHLEIKYSDYTSINRVEFDAKCRELLHALGKICSLKYLLFTSIHMYVRPCLDEWCSVPSSFIHLQRFAMPNGPWFSRVPGWIGQHHSLYDLQLNVQDVYEDDVGVLSQLPSLVRLSLHIQGTPKDKIIIHGTGFPVLKHFDVGCMRISYLTFEAGAMPKLERLELRFNALGWDRYGGVPAGIECLSGLKEIIGRIGNGYAKVSNQKAAESALRDVAGLHPGHPVSNIKSLTGARYVFDGYDNEPREQEDKNSGSNSLSFQ